MPLEEPAWWYRKRPTLTALALLPIAGIYGLAAGRRMQQPSTYQSKLPVICVGNLTAGGTGKTPTVIELAQRLSARGLRCAVLTRGHGGQERGPVVVDPSTHTARDVGDEPLLIAAHATVVVSRKRDLGAQAIEDLTPSVDAIVMDDGLQNPQLAKDLRLAVVDGGRGLGNGLVIPAGPLRAPTATQLPLIDALIINRRAVDETATGLQLPAGARNLPYLDAAVAPTGETAWLEGADVVAFAGIGNPQRFYDLLQRLGANIVDARSFADHKLLTEADADCLLKRAKETGGLLVTTAKDAVRLRNEPGRRAELTAQTRVLDIRLEFDDASSGQLDQLIDRALATAQRPEISR